MPTSPRSAPRRRAARPGRAGRTGRSIRTGRAGFTLFEVLIAFAVMALVLGAVVPGQASLLMRADRAEARLLATDYALSRLAALGVSEAALPGEARYRDWRVMVDVAPATLDGASDLTLERLTVRVADRAGRLLAEVEELRPTPAAR